MDEVRIRRIAASVSAVCLVVTLASCGAASRPAATRSSPTVATTEATPTSSTTTAPTTTTSGPPAGAGYEAARVQWVGETAVVSSADQNTALQLAVADLERGKSADRGNTSGYSAAIAAIRGFERIPITSVTATEAAKAKADIKAVNAFFGLAPRTDKRGCIAAGPGATAATGEWVTEPADTSSGVTIAPLRQVTNYLRQGESADRGDKSCYPAAIADLQNLQTATAADIAASSGRSPTGGYRVKTLYGDEIAYLNRFFGIISPANDSRPVLTNEEPGG